MDCRLPGSSVRGILQAGKLESLPFPPPNCPASTSLTANWTLRGDPAPICTGGQNPGPITGSHEDSHSLPFTLRRIDARGSYPRGFSYFVSLLTQRSGCARGTETQPEVLQSARDIGGGARAGAREAEPEPEPVGRDSSIDTAWMPRCARTRKAIGAAWRRTRGTPGRRCGGTSRRSGGREAAGW